MAQNAAVKHDNLQDLADEGEELGNDLFEILQLLPDDDVRIAATNKLDRLLMLLGVAVDWHSGIHFEPDFNSRNAIEH